MNKLSSLSSTIYGILLIIGGIMGFVKAHSKWSLITGLISGALILLATKRGSFNSRMQHFSVALISLLLATFFYFRFNTTHLFMPSGLMLILSALNFVIVGLSWIKSKK